MAALALSACGGEAKHASPPRPPTFPRLLGGALAARSDEVAGALERGDSCRAFALSRQLRREAIAAINSGRVTGELQEDLAAAVNDLAARLACVPSTPAKPTNAEHEKPKHEKRKHERREKKEHGKDD